LFRGHGDYITIARAPVKAARNGDSPKGL
jgi:hypothetical protein